MYLQNFNLLALIQSFFSKNFPSIQSSYGLATSEFSKEISNFAKDISHVYQTFDFEKNITHAADRYKNSSELIKKNGYPVEEHTVVTNDGYILDMYRIVGDGLPVVLVHGFLTSSDFFLVSQKKSLAFQLADDGYDVWLPNCRGNVYSRKHVVLSPHQREFWQFSWHEMGTQDAPAFIDYILHETNRSKLAYIGHGQGTTIAYVMLSNNVTYNDKVSPMISLAPLAWTSNMYSPIIQLVAKFLNTIKFINDILGVKEFLPRNELTEIVTREVFSSSIIAASSFDAILFTFFGFSFSQIDLHNIQNQISHYIAGASIRQVYHYLQGINSGEFREYDFGEHKNQNIYGSPTPPAYPVDKITCDMYFIYSDNDWISSHRDLQKLTCQLKNVTGEYKVPKNCNHLDYCWGKHANDVVFPKIKEVLPDPNHVPLLLEILQKTEESLKTNAGDLEVVDWLEEQS